MPCYSPLKAYRAKSINPSGKRGIVFNTNDGYIDMPVELPCGQCIGCRLEKSRQWALRCVHENSLHQDSCFLTLTYDENNLPYDGGLDKTHFQKFMKRYRKHVEPQKIRFFHCGEYGDETKRPHYHALIFGHDFEDKQLHRQNANKDNLYISDTLATLWPYGFSLIGAITFESAAYVARYIMKKQTGEKAKEHYTRIDPDTGEFFEIEPEYTTMSRRPGIGQGWYEKYGKETYRDDFIIQRGMKMQPPKYYDEQYPDIKVIKSKRIRRAKEKRADNTPERLRVKENCKYAQIRALKRNLTED